GCGPDAAGRADAPWFRAPGTAAKHSATAISCCPRRAIGGRPVVVKMITVLDPLPHIAHHIVKAERIGLERTDRRRLAIVPVATAVKAICISLADLVAPKIGRRRSCTCRIFPFGFGEQSVGLTRHHGEPGRIRLGVIPAHIDDWLLAPSPAFVVAFFETATD